MNDQAGARGTTIPMFNQHGTALSQEERENIARKRGVCVRCGLKTHDVGMFKRTPLNSDHVYEGTCIRCNTNAIPQPVLQVWERKFRPQAPVSQLGPEARFRMVGRLATVGARKPTQRPQVPVPARPTAQRPPASQYQNPQVPQRPPTSQRQQGSHAQHLWPRESNSVPHHQSRSIPSELGGNSQVLPPSALQVLPPSALTVSPEVMINEDYSGGNSEEDSWQLVGALRENKGKPDVLRLKLHRLRNIGDTQAGALYEIKELMEHYTNDSRVMAACCGAVWGVSALSDDLKAQGAESGALNIIVDSLDKPNNQRDADFAQWAIGSICCLSHGYENRRVIADAGGIEKILDWMKRQPASAGVFEWSCRALHSLVFEYEGDEGSPDTVAIKNNIAMISEGEGLAVIISSMKGHYGETIAQLWAVRLLWRLQDRGGNDILSARVVERIIKEGGISVCAKILKTRSTNPAVFEATAALLYRLLVFAGSDSFDKAADCMVTIIRKMADNPGEIEMQEACCNLLSILASTNRLLFKESDGLKAVVTAMASAVENVSLQRAAISVLWSVSYITAFFDFAYLDDALSAVDAAQRSNPDDIELLISSCGFIANAATTPTANSCDIPYKIPIHALSLKDEHPLLLNQAGRALGNICNQCPKLMKKIAAANGIESLLECLNSTSTQLLQTVYGALASIGESSDNSKKEIIANGCFDIAKAHIQSSASVPVIEKALKLLSILASTEKRSAMNMPGDIFQVILQVMQSRMSNPQNLEQTCSAMRCLLVVSTPGSTTLNFSGLIDSMTGLINNRANPVDLKREACGVLWAFAARHANQPPHDLSAMFESVLAVMTLYKGEDEQYNSALQSTACGALASITACIRENTIHIGIEAVEQVIAVMYMAMEYDLENNNVLEKFMDTLLNLSFVNETVVIQSGGIVVAIDAMVEHEGEESVQERGCAILAVLASTENLEVNLCIAETDGIDMIVSALAIFSANKRIQVDACKALSHLSVDHESRMLIASQGGLILIVNAMNSNLDNVDLLEGACSALLNLSSDAEEQVLSDSNAVETVINVMQNNPDAIRLQEKALGVLQNVSMRNSAAKLSIAQAGGIEAVTMAIKEFMGSTTVLERAFTTMWSLAVLERNQIEIANLGGIGLVVNGMMANIDDSKVQKQACGCLCTLSSNSRNKTLIREAGGVDAIVYAMWAHYDSEVLQVEACRSLSSLAVNVQTNEVMIATDGEINAIISAMRLFPESHKLQEHACVALRNFMLSEDNADLIRSNGSELRHLMTHAAARFPEKCSERANQVIDSL